MAEQQRLNSLDRFRKQPTRVVLEEHSHCEVPAGCGGVVFRWRNPQAAVPVTIHLYSPWQLTWRLDGVEPQASRLDLVPGTHVLGFIIKNVNPSAGIIMFAAIHDPKEHQRMSAAAIEERPLKVVTDEIGTWKCTVDQPATDEWLSAAFDD